MRYIELTLPDAQKVFLNVNSICSVTSYDGSVKSIVTCVNGKEFKVVNNYEDVIFAIVRSWGVNTDGNKDISSEV